MSLPPSHAPRTLIHERQVRFEGYKRSDGLWDIEARLADVKTVVTALSSGERAAGEPVHDMRVRLTVDLELNVRDASVSSDSNPYPGYCDEVEPEYRRLIGLNLARGFRRKVQELFGGIQGCTHVNELLSQFPTAAIQAVYSERREAQAPGTKPFQLDRCRALDTRGEAVRLYYAPWYRREETGT